MCRAVFAGTELPSPGLRARLSRRESENQNSPYLPHQQHFHQPAHRLGLPETAWRNKEATF